jgi:hypothetical protein
MASARMALAIEEERETGVAAMDTSEVGVGRKAKARF